MCGSEVAFGLVALYWAAQGCQVQSFWHHSKKTARGCRHKDYYGSAKHITDDRVFSFGENFLKPANHSENKCQNAYILDDTKLTYLFPQTSSETMTYQNQQFATDFNLKAEIELSEKISVMLPDSSIALFTASCLLQSPYELGGLSFSLTKTVLKSSYKWVFFLSVKSFSHLEPQCMYLCELYLNAKVDL